MQQMQPVDQAKLIGDVVGLLRQPERMHEAALDVLGGVSGPHPCQSERGVEIELVSKEGTVVERAKSDREGFYAFENVPTGREYSVRVDPNYLARWNFHTEVPFRNFERPKEGAFQSGYDFGLIAGPEEAPKAAPKRKGSVKKRR